MRPQTRMHLTVSTQAARVLEGLATLFTHIRPLTRVLPQVILVVGAPFKSKRAVRTLEGPYSCMYLGERTIEENGIHLLLFYVASSVEQILKLELQPCGCILPSTSQAAHRRTAHFFVRRGNILGNKL